MKAAMTRQRKAERGDYPDRLHDDDTRVVLSYTLRGIPSNLWQMCVCVCVQLCMMNCAF